MSIILNKVNIELSDFIDWPPHTIVIAESKFSDIPKKLVIQSTVTNTGTLISEFAVHIRDVHSTKIGGFRQKITTQLLEQAIKEYNSY